MSFACQCHPLLFPIFHCSWRLTACIRLLEGAIFLNEMRETISATFDLDPALGIFLQALARDQLKAMRELIAVVKPGVSCEL